jgi:hypothetical protein
VRIALSRPEDVDDEVRGLMRRAYEENTAPPPPRRPARRPGAVVGTMTVVIDGSELPGRTWPPGTGRTGPPGHLRRAGRPQRGPPRADHVEQARDGHRAGAWGRARGRWEMPVTVRRDEDGFDFGGPFVRGVRDDRHLGLIWGT